MALWMVLFLAAMQGVAEFLPISSSGHLRIAEAMFGVAEPQTLFDVMLHLGTLVAVVVVYRQLLWRMTRATLGALARPLALGRAYRDSADFRLFALVCLGMVPTALVAAATNALSKTWAEHVALVGCGLLVTSTLLFALGRVLARRAKAATDGRTIGLPLDQLSWRHALAIGAMQGVSASFRGISRSGTTISGGVFVGLSQEAAAAYSFLLSIPAVLGALVLSLKDYRGETDVVVPGLIGAGVSTVVGIIALRFLLAMLRRGRLGMFSVWCLAVGVTAIVWDLTRAINP